MGSLHRSASPAQIEAAEAYEKLFVPALFGEWAPRVAAAAGVGPGDRVLDVAKLWRASGPTARSQHSTQMPVCWTWRCA
jgi:hypothetical protein